MTLREKLFESDESDRAVSPVIGVILMVAITVILAAVIGTFVLQIGNQTGSNAPSVSLTFNDAGPTYNDAGSVTNDGDTETRELLQFEQQGGQTLPADSIKINVRDNDNNLLGVWDAGDWDDTASSSDETLDLVLTLNGEGTGSSSFATGSYESTTIQTGDVVTLHVEIAESSSDGGGNDNGDYDISDAYPTDSRYTITIIDKESDDKIAENTVYVE